MLINRIKHFRNLKKVSQEDLSIEIEISQSQISKFENGDSTVSIELLHKISLALGLELFELLYENENDLNDAINRWQSHRNI